MEECYPLPRPRGPAPSNRELFGTTVRFLNVSRNRLTRHNCGIRGVVERQSEVSSIGILRGCPCSMAYDIISFKRMDKMKGLVYSVVVIQGCKQENGQLPLSSKDSLGVQCLTRSQPARRCAWRLGNTTVGGNLGLETGALPRSEVVHAAIVAVVHVVVETINPIRMREHVTFEGGDSRGLTDQFLHRGRYHSSQGSRRQGQPRLGCH